MTLESILASTAPEIVAGIAYFFSVFAKAFQQRNVAFMNYWMLFPVSYVLALADITVWSMIIVTILAAVKEGSLLDMWFMTFCVGTGGGCGATSATYLHHRFFTKERFK